jgi:hypothetical protein
MNAFDSTPYNREQLYHDSYRKTVEEHVTMLSKFLKQNVRF